MRKKRSAREFYGQGTEPESRPRLRDSVKSIEWTVRIKTVDSFPDDHRYISVQNGRIEMLDLKISAFWVR